MNSTQLGILARWLLNPAHRLTLIAPYGTLLSAH